MSSATNRPALINEIKDALKNRQHVEINGHPIDIKKLLDDLIKFERGKAIIPATHEEDLIMHVIQKVGFPASGKMNVEQIMRQVLQEFGWPATKDLSHVQFYFSKLLKELYHDRVAPVFLFEHPEIIKPQAFQMLEIISEYLVDRKPLGIPCIICITDSPWYQRPSICSDAFQVALKGELTFSEIYGQIEEVCPGMSTVFDERAVRWIQGLYSPAAMKARAKELISYMRKLGLHVVNEELVELWKNERKQITHGKKAA